MSTSQFKTTKIFQINAVNFFDKAIIVSTIILLTVNIIDIELTLWGIRLHLIEEGNPMMQLLIQKNPLFLMTLKLLLPIILGTACWGARNTSRKLIVYGMGITLFVYFFITLMHAYWLYAFIVI